MRLDAVVGYGAAPGTWAIPNLLRVFIGETGETGYNVDTVTVLETNIDDQNPEHYGHLMEQAYSKPGLFPDVTPDTDPDEEESPRRSVLSVIAKPE